MVGAAPALRIVFFGTPEFAVPTLETLHASRHPVVAVVTQPDRARGRGQKSTPGPVKRVAEAFGIPIFQPDRLRSDEFLSAFRGLHPDLGVVAAYGKILTEAVLEIPRHGMLNVHASLLPRYRGAAPIHRAVMAGETVTGITIMRVVQALDAGPMVAKVTRPIGPDETSAEVEADLARIGGPALVEAVDALSEGRLNEQAQNDAEATYAQKIEKADGIVDWSRSANDIHNQIRGLHPWPHAYAELNGERTILLRSQIDVQPESADAEPGTIVHAAGDRLVVQTGRGMLRLLSLQREGRRPVSAREFLAGRQIRLGDRFVRSQPVP